MPSEARQSTRGDTEDRSDSGGIDKTDADRDVIPNQAHEDDIDGARDMHPTPPC